LSGLDDGVSIGRIAAAPGVATATAAVAATAAITAAAAVAAAPATAAIATAAAIAATAAIAAAAAITATTAVTATAAMAPVPTPPTIGEIDACSKGCQYHNCVHGIHLLTPRNENGIRERVPLGLTLPDGSLSWAKHMPPPQAVQILWLFDSSTTARSKASLAQEKGIARYTNAHY
jgi:hypothetical protein